MKLLHALLIFAFTLLPFPASAQTVALAGQWQFIASPDRGGADTIVFTATPSADGTHLQCHADVFITRANRNYPMDWKMTVEQKDGQMRLGWVLDADNPASTEEYQEPASHYAIGGKDADGSHRYIYLLSQNIDTYAFEGMTLWTDWQLSASASFALPRTYHIFALASQDKPYKNAVGWIDIWASGSVKRLSGATGIREASSDVSRGTSDVYDLQGRLLQSRPAKGLYIRNGRKYAIK